MQQNILFQQLLQHEQPVDYAALQLLQVRLAEQLLRLQYAQQMFAHQEAAAGTHQQAPEIFAPSPLRQAPVTVNEAAIQNFYNAYVRTVLAQAHINQVRQAERQMKIQRYKSKKRVWKRTISYDCRKSVAIRRERVKGRFVSKSAAQQLANPQPQDNAPSMDSVSATSRRAPAKACHQQQLLENVKVVQHANLFVERADESPSVVLDFVAKSTAARVRQDAPTMVSVCKRIKKRQPVFVVLSCAQQSQHEGRGALSPEFRNSAVSTAAKASPVSFY